MIKTYCILYNSQNAPLLTIDTTRTTSNGKLVSYNINNMDRGDSTDTIAWGIYSNNGELSFVLPINKESLFREDVDFRDYYVTFYNHNDIEDYHHILAKYFITDFKYNRTTRIVELELTDRLEDWQNITVKIDIPDTEYSDTESLLSIYETVLEQNTGLPRILFDDGVEKLLGSIYVGYKYRDATISFWDFMTEICSLSGTRIIRRASGATLLSLGEKNRTAKVNSKHILSTEPNCSKRHNSISSVKINIPRETRLEPVTSEFSFGQLPTDQFKFTKTETWQKGDIAYRKAWFEYNYGNTSTGQASKITLRENAKRANIVGETPSGTYPRNLLWKYAKAGSVNNEKLTFHNNDSGVLSAISISAEYETDRYVTSFKGMINSYEYNLIASTDVSWPVSFIEQQVQGVEIYGNVIEDGASKSETRQLEAMGAKDIELSSSPWIYVSKKSGDNLYDWLFDKVAKFKDGRTCIEMSCVLDEYYDTDGNVAISKGRTFELYDVIIPYISKKGEQVPYLGTVANPMKFIVVGVNYSYNGHFVQKLTLQEYIES